jgi:hypothetical protein
LSHVRIHFCVRTHKKELTLGHRLDFHIFSK